MVSTEKQGEYRVFCAYGPNFRVGGCLFETYVDSEEKARKIAESHSSEYGHRAEYEESL